MATTHKGGIVPSLALGVQDAAGVWSNTGLVRLARVRHGKGPPKWGTLP